MTDSNFKVLESTLRYLSYWYSQDNVEEISVNRPGEIRLLYESLSTL